MYNVLTGDHPWGRPLFAKFALKTRQVSGRTKSNEGRERDSTRKQETRRRVEDTYGFLSH